MSIETFDWQGYMSDIGYAPEQIPNEINDEDREWLYGLWARDLMEQLNYEAKQNPFLATSKEKANEARRQFLEYAPDLAHLFGEEVQPNDPNTTYDPEEFRKHVVNNKIQNANLGYYLDTFAASRINEDTDVKYPWLKGLTKDQFKKHFMEQQDIDEAWTSVDDIRNGNFGTLAANYQAQLAQQQGGKGDGKSGHMAALKQGWYEFEKLFGYTAGTLGDATGIQWLSDIGNEIAQNVIQKSDAYNYQSKYNQSLADTIKNEGVMAAGGKILNMAEENWATTAAPLALAAIGKILSTYAHVPQPLADAATRAVAANVVRRQGANLLRRASQLAYGSSAALSGLEIGGVRAELEEKGKYDPNNVADVVAAGLVSSSLDFIGNVAAMKGLTITAGRLWRSNLATMEARSRLAKEIAEDQAKSFTRRVLSAMAVEGVTEGLQEIPAMVVGARRGIEYTSKEVRDRIIDAAAVGAFMGGGIRAGEIALEKYHRGDEESPTDTDADETPETPDAPEAPSQPSQPPPPDFDGEMPFNNVTYRPTENGFVAADPFNVGYGATRNEAAEDFLKNANKGRVDIDANDIRSVPSSATEEGSSIVRYGNNGEHSVRIIGQGSNALIRKIIDIHNNPKNAVNLQGHNTFNVSDFQSTNPDLNEDQFIRSVLEQKKTGRGSSNDVIANRKNAVDIPVNLTAVPRTDIAGSYAAFNLDQDSRDALRDKGFTILSNPKSRENGRIQKLLLYRNGFVYTVILRNSATDDNVSAVVEAEHIKDINARRQITNKDQNNKARQANIKRNSLEAGVRNQTLRVVTTDPVTDIRSTSERKSSITIAPVLRAGFVELNRKVNAEGVEEFTIDPRKILEKRIKDANGKIEKIGERGITYTSGGETTRLDITADGRVVVSTDGRFVGDYEFFDPANLTEGELRASFQSTRIEATQPFRVIEIPEELQFDGRVTFVYEGDANTPENRRNYYAIRNNGDVYYISPAEDNYIKRLLKLQYIQNLNDARDVFDNQFIEFYALPSFYEDGDVNQFVGFKTENNLLPVVNLEDPTLHRFSNMEVDELISAGYNAHFVKVYAIIAPNGEVVRATTEEGVDAFIEDIKGYANILDDSEWNPSSRRESIFGDTYTESGFYTERDIYSAGYEVSFSDEGVTDVQINEDNDNIRKAIKEVVDQIKIDLTAIAKFSEKKKSPIAKKYIEEFKSVVADLESSIDFSISVEDADSQFLSGYLGSTPREFNEILRRRLYAARTAQAMLHIDSYRSRLSNTINHQELKKILDGIRNYNDSDTTEQLRQKAIQAESIAIRLEEAYIDRMRNEEGTQIKNLLWEAIYSDPVEGNYGSFVNRIHSEGTDFRFSRAAETPRVRRKDFILNELQRELGDFTLNEMLEKGIRGESGGLVILPDQEAAHEIERMFTTDATQPYYDDEGLIQGFVAPDGMIYLVEDGIVDGKARQIILHEYGVHARKFGMTDAQFQEVVQNIKAKRDEKSFEGDFVRHAITRAKRANKNMSEDNPIFWEEVAAYAVEDGYHLADTGIVGRMQTWMKNWLWRFGVIDATAFHYQDFVNMAQGMLGNPGPLSFFDGTHDYTKYQDSWKNLPKFSRTVLAEDSPDREEFAQRTYRRLRGLDDAIDRERNGEDADSIEQATDWRRNDQGDWNFTEETQVGLNYPNVTQGTNLIRFSKVDIEKLSYDFGNYKNVSLKQFSDTFQRYIKQRDKTIEDVERISADYIKNVGDDPLTYISQLNPAKVNYLRYFFVQGEKLYTEEGEDALIYAGPDYDINRRVIALYRRALSEEDFNRLYNLLSIPRGEQTEEEKNEISILDARARGKGIIKEFAQKEADVVNRERNEAIQNLAEYFDGNPDYHSSEKALILWGATRYAITEKMTDNGLDVRLWKISDNNDARVMVVPGEWTAKIVEHLRKGATYEDALVEASKEMKEISAAKRGVPIGFTGWKVYEQNDSYEAGQELQQAVAGTGWCTGASVETAQMHRRGGDFHVYFENGEPTIAIRTENGRMAEPPRGAHKGQFCTPEEEVIAEEYIRSQNKIVAGDDYLKDRDDIRRLASGNITWQEAFMFPAERRYANGEFGRNTKAWPEVVKKALSDILERHREERVNAGWYFIDEAQKLNKNTEDVKRNATLIKVPEGRSNQLVEGEYPKLTTIIGKHILLRESSVVPNLATIEGSLTVDGEVDISSLKTINGSLEYRGTTGGVLELENLRGLKINSNKSKDVELIFPKLTRIEGFDIARGKVSFLNLTTIGDSFTTINKRVNLPSLTVIDGSINISKGVNLPSLTTIKRNANIEENVNLPSLTTIEGNADIGERTNVSSLTVIGGRAIINEGVDASSLTSIGGYATIFEKSIISNLRTIEGSATIGTNAIAPELVEIKGDVTISRNVIAPKLKNIKGDAQIFKGAYLPSLLTIEGNAKIDGGVNVDALEVIEKSVTLGKGVNAPALKATGISKKRSIVGYYVIIEDGVNAPLLETIGYIKSIGTNTNVPLLHPLLHSQGIFRYSRATAEDLKPYKSFINDLEDNLVRERISSVPNEGDTVLYQRGDVNEFITRDSLYTIEDADDYYPDLEQRWIDYHRDDSESNFVRYSRSIPETDLVQRFTSQRTSLPQNDPALYKNKWFLKELKEGSENFDIGAGITTKPTERLASLGVRNVPFDPFNREQTENAQAIQDIIDGKRYPTVTVANVLNVIAEPESRSNVILQAAKALDENGKAFFDVYVAPREGETSIGTYQTAMRPEEYLPEIERWFNDTERHGSVIIASSPKEEVNTTEAVWWDANPQFQGNIIRYSRAATIDDVPQTPRQRGMQVPNAPGMYKMPDGSLHIEPSELPVGFESETILYAAIAISDPAKEEPKIAELRGLILTDADLMRETDRMMRERNDTNEDHRLGYAVSLILEAYDPTSDIYQQTVDAFHEAVSKATGGAYQNLILDTGQIEAAAHAAAGIPYEALLTAPQETVPTPRQDAAEVQRQELQDAFDNSDAQREYMQVGEDGRAFISTDDSDVDVIFESKVTNPFTTGELTDKVLVDTTEHTESDDFYNHLADSPHHGTQEPLDTGSFTRRADTIRSEVESFLANVLPEHIWNRMEILWEDNAENRKVLDNALGKFSPKAWQNKNIVIRGWDRTFGQVVRTAAREASRFGWNLWQNRDFRKALTDFYDMFSARMYEELRPYYNQMGVTDPTKLTNGQKIFMVQTFFSKLNQSLFTDDQGNMADILGIDAQEYRRILSNVRRGISAQENDLTPFMRGLAGDTELAKQFAQEMLRMTMETATNIGTHFVYERANTLGGKDKIYVYTNEWGTWRRPIANTRFGKVAAQIKENLEWWNDRWKGSPRAERFARWMMRNLPMGFKGMKLFHLYVPDARLGDTTLGKASQLISRVWQRIGDMSGTTIPQDYALMEEIHDILRDHGYDPLVANDMVDQNPNQTYVQFFQSLGITSAKAMEKARLADEVVRTSKQLKKEQAANIRSMIVETGVSLYNRMVNAGVSERYIKRMVNDFENKRQKFHDNYSHRMYEAFTPEGKSELSRMLHYLKRDPATGELTIAKRARNAEDNIRKAEARYGRGTSQFYKATIEDRKDLRRYERLMHLWNFEMAVLKEKKRLFGAELNEAIVTAMKNTIKTIVVDSQSVGRIDAQAVPHYNSISAQKVRKLDPSKAHHRELMAFLSEIKDPMRVAVYSADQQRQIIAKLQFNKELGEYLVDNNMADIRGIPNPEGIARDLAQMESGTFLEYINVDPEFMPEIKAEWENMQKVTETVLDGITDAVKANSTVYSLRLAMNNYIGNASMLLASGHFWRFGQWMNAGDIVRKQFLDRFTYGAKDPSDFGKLIIKEMEAAMVTGGSGTEMSVFQLNKNAHENFVQMMTGLLYGKNLISRGKKFKIDNFVKKSLEYARKFYTYGDEWVKPLMYINNRMNAIAKYEAILKRENGETEEDYKERVLKKAIEEASEMTIRETVSWENSPFMVRQLSTKSVRFFVPDFLLHNFQMLRITASNYVRLMELGRELLNFNPTDMNPDKVADYRSALVKEFAQRSVGGAMTAGVYAGLVGATGSCMAFIPYMMNTLMAAINGEDDKDKDNTFFNPQEWEGAQRILNYKTGGDNFFVPAWKHNGKIYAWNYGRASVMLTHAVPQPATENPEFMDYAAQFFKNIVNIGGGTIAQEIVNNAQGKDKWGRDIGMEAGWGKIIDRVIVPGAVRQLMDMSIGYPGSENPYREGKAIKMSDAVGITVNAYDMRDIVNELGWDMGRVGSNAQNVVRKSFIKRLTQSNALSDSDVASMVSDMREDNAKHFDRANYLLAGLRQMGMENKDIQHWLTTSRKDAGTILSKKQATAFLKGHNVYDDALVTYLKNKRNNLAKGQDDVRMSKEELAVVLQNYDKAIRIYSQALRTR